MLKVGEVLKKDKRDVNAKVKEASKSGSKGRSKISGLDVSSEDEDTSRAVRMIEKPGHPVIKISSNGSRKVQEYVSSTIALLAGDSKTISLVAEDKAIEKLVKVIEQIKNDYKTPLNIKNGLRRSEILKPDQTKDLPIMEILISKT